MKTGQLVKHTLLFNLKLRVRLIIPTCSVSSCQDQLNWEFFVYELGEMGLFLKKNPLV